MRALKQGEVRDIADVLAPHFGLSHYEQEEVARMVADTKERFRLPQIEAKSTLDDLELAFEEHFAYGVDVRARMSGTIYLTAEDLTAIAGACRELRHRFGNLKTELEQRRMERQNLEVVLKRPDGTETVQYRMPRLSGEATRAIAEVETLKERLGDECPYSYRFVDTGERDSDNQTEGVDDGVDAKTGS